MNKIIVLGATGMIGEKLSKALVNAGNLVCLATRNPEKAALKFPGIEIRKADVFDPLSVLSAIEGNEVVVISLSPERTSAPGDKMPEREGLHYIIEASKKLGVKRIVLISSIVQNYEGMNGFHWWIFQMKMEAVKAIKTSGIPYSIFYLSSIMETLQRDIIRGNRILLISGSEAKNWFISAADLGKQVAKALDIAGSSNQEYPIQGLEGFDWEETALLIKEHYNPSLKISRLPLWVLKFAGKINRTAHYGAHICEALNKYPEKFESEQTWKDLGKPSVTLKDFLISLRSS